MKHLKLFENQNFDHLKLKGMVEEYQLLNDNIVNYLELINIDSSKMNYHYTKDVVVSTPQAQCNHSL
jgi:hypothetical protein